MRRVLFICSRARQRSPTAERVFGGRPNVETASAGLAPDADEPLTPDHLEWADMIFVMEKVHRARLNRRFKPWLKTTRVICLDIADDYDFMDPALVALLEARVGSHLRLARS